MLLLQTIGWAFRKAAIAGHEGGLGGAYAVMEQVFRGRDVLIKDGKTGETQLVRIL